MHDTLQHIIPFISFNTISDGSVWLLITITHRPGDVLGSSDFPQLQETRISKDSFSNLSTELRKMDPQRPTLIFLFVFICAIILQSMSKRQYRHYTDIMCRKWRHKKPRSMYQKCRWQVTAKHAYTVSVWNCMSIQRTWPSMRNRKTM